ncbi:hypothetical protein [Streptomyces mesophilus]|uniref:hypothetical protein n=1 Tax=Streptomyces mesophilus TaxID=1775132 RepID=UPI001F26AD26|nr:hypothetical protein [Streptomyces mesophilus]
MSGSGRGLLLWAFLLAVSTVACGTADERRDAADAATTRFEAAVRDGDAVAMCRALAPGTRTEVELSGEATCAESVLGEELPYAGAVRTVDVFGRQARVVLQHDTVFLSQFPEGWKVVAAGCRPQHAQPYRCTVKGS